MHAEVRRIPIACALRIAGMSYCRKVLPQAYCMSARYCSVGPHGWASTSVLVHRIRNCVLTSTDLVLVWGFIEKTEIS